MNTLVFCNNRQQFEQYCQWKGLIPETDAYAIYRTDVSHAKDLCKRKLAPVPANKLVVLPGVTGLSKQARKILTDEFA